MENRSNCFGDDKSAFNGIWATKYSFLTNTFPNSKKRVHKNEKRIPALISHSKIIDKLFVWIHFLYFLLNTDFCFSQHEANKQTRISDVVEKQDFSIDTAEGRGKHYKKTLFTTVLHSHTFLVFHFRTTQIEDEINDVRDHQILSAVTENSTRNKIKNSSLMCGAVCKLIF